MAQRFPFFFVAAFLLACPLYAAAQEKTTTTREDPIVAKFGDQEIRRSEVEGYRQAQFPQAPMESVFDRLLDAIINERLVAEKAVKLGLENDPRVQQIIKRTTLEVMTTIYIQDRVKKSITKEKMEEAYKGYLRELPEQEEVHAFHIEVGSKAEADQIIADLKGGASFTALATEKSSGPQASKGGDVGFLTKDRTPPPLIQAVFGLQKDAFSTKPVKVENRWHIFKVTEIRVAAPPTYDQVEELLYRQLSQIVLSNTVKGLREEAGVVRFALDGTPIE